MKLNRTTLRTVCQAQNYAYTVTPNGYTENGFQKAGWYYTG